MAQVSAIAVDSEPSAQTQVVLGPAQQQALSQAIAGYSTQQLIWTSGYLAGLASAPALTGEIGPSTHATAAPAAIPGTAPTPTTTVLFGSQTGNGEAIAAALQQRLAAKGLPAQCINLRDYRPTNLKKEAIVFMVVSTHGEGDAPDDAEDFHEFLHSARAPQLPDLQYAVLALGDSSYEHFCATGVELDQRLNELGAQRLTARVDCDLDYQSAAEAWSEELELRLEELVNLEQSPAPVLLHPLQDSSYDAKSPFAATLLANQRITGRDSSKDVRHLELSLEDSGLRYLPGDSLSVVTRNAESTVTAIAAALDLDLASQVNGPSATGTLREVLSTQLEVTQLSRGFLEQYNKLAQSDQLASLLADGPRLRDYIQHHHVLDVISEYPAKAEPQDWVDSLRRLVPRQYSIASSQAIHEDEVHLTVAPVRFARAAYENLGVASTHLSDRLLEGETVGVFVSRNDRFRLPAEPNAPIIMVGPGTGVAPFRAFLQQREADVANGAAAGRNWLFFGDRHFDTDFLYQTEWQKYLKDGLLTRLDVAFSRDQSEKLYVQHRMLEQAEELFAWLEQGAYFYVCGDAGRMASDVDTALHQIVASAGALSDADAAEYIKQLRRSGRYQKDVY